MARELEVLLAAAGPGEKGCPASLLSQELDWDLLVRQAIGHGIATRLFRALELHGRELVPRQTWLELEEHHFSVVAMNLPRLEQLTELLDSLERARVAAVAFKGPLLEATLGRDPLCRESTDLDVLVARSDVGRASEALAAAGYLPLEGRRRKRDEVARPLQKHYLFEPDDTALAMVELHAEVMEPEWAIELPTVDLLRRSEPIEFAGATRRQLQPEDLLLALALHGTSHGWRRLMWLGDLAGLLERLSEESVALAVERAARIGCRRVLTMSCDLASRLLRVAPRAAVDTAVRRDPVTRSLSARLERTLAHPLSGARAMRLPAIDRLRLRERPGDTLAAAFRHARMGWFLLAERLSPFRFGDEVRPVRSPDRARARHA